MPTIRLATNACGTRFECVIASAHPSAARAAGEEALREIELWDARLSLFRRDSQIAAVNRGAALGPVRVEPETFALLEFCRDLWEASAGAFDPTVGMLMRTLGFHPSAPARYDADAAAAGDAGFQHVRLDSKARSVAFARAAIALDLGAIGKGFALDRAAAILREEGIENALLHGGTSTMIAIGPPASQPAFRIALGPEPGAPVLDLRDAALSVSAPSGRTLEGAGRALSHVLDPKTGRPAGDIALAAALAAEATLADAWSTALVVAGSDLPHRTDVQTLYRTTSSPSFSGTLSPTPRGPDGPLGRWIRAAREDVCDATTATPSGPPWRASQRPRG